MNLYKQITTHEVYPALGCTEPIACAYAAAVAAANLGEPVETLSLKVDRGTYKNGAAVTVPHSEGRKGNLIAAALGALLAAPDAKLHLLSRVTDTVRRQATRLVDSGACTTACLDEESGFRVEVALASASHNARCVLADAHTHIALIEKDGARLVEADASGDGAADLAYRDQLKTLAFTDLLALADDLDGDDMAFLKKGVEMNRAMAERGLAIEGTARQLQRMKEDGFLADDMFFRTKNRVAAAVDARMAGVDQPVMTSGGSGNQGIVAILTLHGVGTEMSVSEETILKSIAVTHAVNAYVKSFTGELAVICGCAMAAGIAAAAGIVYQQAGPDLEKITLAVNNVIGDLGGLICDGAKPGCALKTITSVDAAMRSSLMALRGYGLAEDEGVVGRTVEDSIGNLGRITLEGMFHVDPTVLDILHNKAGKSGKA